MKDIDWSKAPEGATHYDSNDDSDSGWTKIQGGDKFYYTSNDGGAWVPFTMSADSYGCGKLIPRPTPWQGPQDGLPPVGTECEFKSPGHHSNPDFQWCIFRGFMSDGGYIIEYHHHTAPSRVTCSCFDPQTTKFRPIQSERDKATYELARDLGDICPMPEVVNKVIDLGYRKPMKHAEAHDIINDQLERSGEILKCSTRMKIIDALGHGD